jgi:hypothetical protein
LIQVAENPDECFLQHIFRFLKALGIAVANTHHLRGVLIVQPFLGCPFPFPASFDQILVLHRLYIHLTS